jgi:hypothetical protein
MTRKKSLLYFSGTSNGKPVVAGIYKFFETTGLPLDTIFFLIKQKDMVIDWTELYDSIINMPHKRKIAKIEEAISDVYGNDYCKHIIDILNLKE